jgi:hypothetical protein
LPKPDIIVSIYIILNFFSFLIKKCKEFASVAHNVLWYCKVEEEEDKTKGRKVPLPLRENLHEVTVVLRDNILRHMT